MAKDRPPTLAEIDSPDEFDVVEDFTTVPDLSSLSQIAGANQKKVIALCRLRSDLQSKGQSTQEVEERILLRQRRNAGLIKRRTAIQKEEQEALRKRIEEEIRPTTGAINIARNELIERISAMIPDVQKALNQANREQVRRTAARLKLLQDRLKNCLGLLESTFPIPDEVEVE